MAKTMTVNTANMLALHFRRRLHQYVRFRYAKEGKIQLSYNKTKKLVDSCYRVQEVQGFDTNGNPTATTKRGVLGISGGLQKSVSYVSCSIFNVTELETRTRKFGNQVTTDGYAASVLLQREMHTTEPTDTKTTPRKRRKTSESRVTNVVEKDTLDLALDELPDGYTPDIFIGIDPGVRC
ncbi:hypothetical protein F444_06201 [Phytophthora nicotianae P1976]|uniref:Uncharacterized protein n=1 Tax=Phytophthora nicotianae P1976 TaxID=1317066 RepID=A0A081AJK7_PHYNI|nr:hypothetical protein F444_06201 [Phytophthora nicotianae P1976]